MIRTRCLVLLAAAAVAGISACCCYTSATVRPRSRGAGRPGAEPVVRVRLLAVTGEVRLESDEGLVATGDPRRSSAGPVEVRGGRGLESRTGDGRWSAAGDTVEYEAAGGGTVRIGDRRYRGRIRAFAAGSELVVVNVLPVEQYLYGVVPCEIGPINAETFEAVKAQAVAARTFTFSRFGKRTGLGHDLFDSFSRDQEYRGAGCETELGREAVDATRGEVLTYGGGTVEALYHGNCGGVTSSGDAPYLAGAPDTPGHRSGRAPFCAWGRYHTWEQAFSRSEFESGLRRAAGLDEGTRVRSYRAVKEGVRVKELVIATDRGEGRASGVDLRSELGLRSRWFDVAVRGDRVVLTGRGWGHGMGMCQDGAVGMARQGQTCDRILKHYYSGVEIERRY